MVVHERLYITTRLVQVLAPALRHSKGMSSECMHGTKPGSPQHVLVSHLAVDEIIVALGFLPEMVELNKLDCCFVWKL